MTTIRAHFDGRTFVPDEPVGLPPNVRVTLHVDAEEPARPEEIALRLQAIDALERLADETAPPGVDWSRESIYSGTLDDPR